METSAFLSFLLIIISILSGITGIILFITGMFKGKTKMWISGLVFFAAGIIIGIMNFNKSLSVITDNTVVNADSTIAKKKHNNYVFSDSTTYSERPVDSTYAEPISGMVEDEDFKKVYIKIFPSRDIKSCGLSLEDVENGHHSKEVSKAIAVVLNVDKAFSGNLMIHAYDYEKKLLGKSTAKVKGLMGDRKTVNFPFTKSIDFSLIDYCTLGFEE
ncbi:MAG: hypothetical protein V1904_12445 [Bacteroidota bacterium]